MCRIFEERGDERIFVRNLEVVEKLLSKNKFSFEEIFEVADFPLEKV